MPCRDRHALPPLPDPPGPAGGRLRGRGGGAQPRGESTRRPAPAGMRWPPGCAARLLRDDQAGARRGAFSVGSVRSTTVFHTAGAIFAAGEPLLERAQEAGVARADADFDRRRPDGLRHRRDPRERAGADPAHPRCRTRRPPLPAKPVRQLACSIGQRHKRSSRARLQAWNTHDLEATLSHIADDVVFTSPVQQGSSRAAVGSSAARLLCASTGGKNLPHPRPALRPGRHLRRAVDPGDQLSQPVGRARQRGPDVRR